MLLNLQNLIKKHNMKIHGVIQVGCHHSEEHDEYVKAGIENFFYIEPSEKAISFLVNKHLHDDNVIIFKGACGSSYKEVEMFVEEKNIGQSNSILKPKNHLVQYPDIVFTKTQLTKVYTLDYLVDTKESEDYNFLNLDCQCYEMEVLKGATCVLQNIDYIMTEVNNVGAELYEGCTDINELDEFLLKYSFIRVEEPKWIGGTWSDTLYIKQSLIK